MKKLAPATLIVLALLLAVTLAVAAGCGGSKSTEKTDTKVVDTGEKDVSTETVGVAVYAGTKPEEAYPGVYSMVTGDGFDEVVGFYKAELPGATFSEIEIPSGRGASFLVDKDDFSGNVSIEENIPSDGKVTITVSKFNTK